jgi:hypothetical protein
MLADQDHLRPTYARGHASITAPVSPALLRQYAGHARLRRRVDLDDLVALDGETEDGVWPAGEDDGPLEEHVAEARRHSLFELRPMTQAPG